MRTFYKIFCLGFLFFLSGAILNNANGQTSLTLTPKPIFMGKIPIGSSSTRDVSIVNTSAGAVNITSITITGVGSSKYSITNNPNAATLSVFGKLELNVTYQPTTTGQDFAVIQIQSNAGTYLDTLIGHGSLEMNNVPTFERVMGIINKTEDESANTVQQTSDGGFILVGGTTKLDENYPDMNVVKTDEYGKGLWTKTFGGQYADGASDVIALDDGNLIVLGNTESFGAGAFDIYLLKLNSQGEVIWSKTYGGLKDDSGSEIIQTSDGFLIVGTTKNTSDQSSDALIVKTNFDGIEQWKKNYGSTNGEFGSDIVVASGGGFLFVGSVQAANDVNVYLVKIDVTGNQLWSKSLGGVNADEGYSICATNDGGYIIGGYTTSTANARDGYMLKIDVNGNESWSKTFGGSHSDSFSRVIPTADGGYLCIGSINAFFSQQFVYDDLYIVKTNNQGNLVWQKTFGGSRNDYASDITVTREGGYAIVGGSNSFSPRNNIYFLQVNTDGVITEIKENNSTLIPANFSLSQNYPNPFNPSTKISYQLSSSVFVKLRVYDVLGREIAMLVNQEQSQGNYTAIFHASHIPSGVYLYRLQAGSFAETKKMILIK